MENIIWNLTQHDPTPEQKEEGVGPKLGSIVQFLTFETLEEARPASRESRAYNIVETFMDEYNPQRGSKVMVGGANFLMEPLVRILYANGFNPVYSFTQRKSEEVSQPDGSVKKVSTFKHVGFVEA